MDSFDYVILRAGDRSQNSEESYFHYECCELLLLVSSL